MTDLRAGDVLSYSAGTTQTGPDGYRFQSRAGETGGADMLAAVATHRPELLELLGERPPLLLNGYPARTGEFPFGVQVDSYLSIPVGLRALRLARREELCAIVLAQPLWLAELIVRADEQPDDVLPTAMIAAVGGYPMPASLEAALTAIATRRGTDLQVVELFGIAEVDAGALIGGPRDDDGTVVFHPRDDIRVGDADGFLTLSKRLADGEWSAPESSGDRCRVVAEVDGRPSGVVVLEGTRVAPDIRRMLESWDESDWRRRTGYVGRDGPTIRAQARHRAEPAASSSRDVAEEEYYDFARHTGASFLTKPVWS